MSAGSAFGLGSPGGAGKPGDSASNGNQEPIEATAPCPCGSGRTYAGCCGALHDGLRHAGTAEALMRSRYSAFALRNERYLMNSWHPDTRPGQLRLAPGHAWTGLEILGTEAGGPDDTSGTVHYRAHSRSAGGHTDALTELSRFTRLQGRWVYVDGDIED